MAQNYGILKSKEFIYTGNISIPLGTFETSKKDKMTVNSLTKLAIIEYQSGDYYEGYMNSDFSREGIGIYKFNDKISEYKGFFNNNEFEGWGIYKYKNGEVYEGGFKMGFKHGFGKYSYSNNTEFIGYFENDLQSGIGMIKNPENNSKFYGTWLKGLKEGKALFFKKNIMYELFYERNLLKCLKKLNF